MKVLKKLGVIVAVLGFVIMIGYVGSLELGVGNDTTNTIMMVVGLGMFAMGTFAAHGFYFQVESDEAEMLKKRRMNEYIKMTQKTDRLTYPTMRQLASKYRVPVLAYDNINNTFIKLVEYKSPTDWKYVRCDPSGESTSAAHKSRYRFDEFDWEVLL